MSRPTLTLFAAALIAAAPCGAQTAPYKNNRAMAAGDPNLNAGWRWWEQQGRETVHFSEYGGTPQSAQVYLPWFTDGNILKGYELDMYPEDGWVLAYKDFGTPTQAPQFPYFALYNRYRGKFRLMIYKPYSQNNTYYNAELKFMNDGAGSPMSTALLTFRASEKAFLDDFNPAQVDASIGNMTALGSWGVFDFDLAGYDPKLDDPSVDPILQIAITGVKEDSVKGTSRGQMNINQVLNQGKAQLATTRNDFGRVTDAIKNGSKYYKEVSGFQDDLNGWLEGQAAKPAGERSSFYGSAVTLASAALSCYFPAAGALVGFASSFFGGSHKSAPMEPLNFKGMLDLTVEETVTSNQAVLAPLDIYLKPGPQSPMAQRPVQPISWGVFNMATKPKLASEDHYQAQYLRRYNPITHNLEYVKTGQAYSYSIITGTMPEVCVNPNLDMQLVSKRVKFLTGVPSLPFAAYDFGSYNVTGVPDQVALELTFHINNPTRHSDTELKVIRALPLGLTHSTVFEDNGPIGQFD